MEARQSDFAAAQRAYKQDFVKKLDVGIIWYVRVHEYGLERSYDTSLYHVSFALAFDRYLFLYYHYLIS